MSGTERYLRDPRWRNLVILAAIALVTIALAALALARQAGETAPRASHAPFFPDLVSRVGRIAQIRIQSAKGVVDIVFRPERGWVVASHDDYPASFEAIRQTVVGLAALTTIEPKTARPDWLASVDLDSPAHGGSGKEITLEDDKGDVIAALIAGKTTDIGDPSGAVGMFVRRPGDSQSWLVRSVFEPKDDPGDWLDKPVMTIDRTRIQEADIDPVSGPSYAVRRDKPNDADFAIADMPKGRSIAYEGAPDAVAAAVVDFDFDDVRPAKDFDFSDPAHTARVITKTFDGLTVTVNTIRQGQDYWATVSAEGTGAGAQKDAREIDRRASGWAYKLPVFKGVQFTTPLESLLKPTSAAATAH